MGYFVHESSYIDADVSIGEGTKIWHFCHIQNGVIIGKNCSLGQNVNVADHVRIGDGCKLQNNVSVYHGVELEDYVFCGPSMVFTNDLTPRAKYPKGKTCYKKTLLKKGATIGAMPQSYVEQQSENGLWLPQEQWLPIMLWIML